MPRIFLLGALVITSLFGHADFALADTCGDAHDACVSFAESSCADKTGAALQSCKELGQNECDVVYETCLAANSGSNSGGVADKYGLKQTATEAKLPNMDKDLPGIVGIIIASILGLVATIFFALMVYGGFLWMTAAGNGEQVGQAKKLIMNAVLGVIVISAAYAITNFVLKAIV